MPESGENRSMLGQSLASELRIKIYKEISAGANEIAEAVDSIMMTVNEPRIALTDDLIQVAGEVDSSSDLFSFVKSKPGLTVSILGLTVAMITTFGVMLMRKK